jgi:hypothetical protein
VNGNLWWGDEYYNFAGGFRMQLANEEVLVCGNSLDVRSFDIFRRSDNKQLGQVSVGPKWIGQPHSLWARDLAKGLPGSDFSLMAADMSQTLSDYVTREVAAGTRPAYQLSRLLEERRGAINSGTRASRTQEASSSTPTHRVAQTSERQPEEGECGHGEHQKVAERAKLNDVSIDEDIRARMKRLGPAY